MEKPLEIAAVVGFEGKVQEGLILHPDNEHLIFPLGSTVVVRHIINRTQTFLRGHDNDVTVIQVSPSGRYIASGQNTHQGFQADIIIWDFEDGCSLLYRLKMHKVKIQSLTFSCNEKFLASIGENDEKNQLLIWDVEQGKPLYGSSLGINPVQLLKFFNRDSARIVAITDKGILLLTIDQKNKKIKSLGVNLGNIKRKWSTCIIDPEDEFVYCGSTSGDLVEVNIERAIYKRMAPYGKNFSLGVKSLGILPNGDFLVGAGDGTIAKISIQTMKVKKRTKVWGGVSSLTFTQDFTHFFAGTDESNIYWVNSDQLQAEVRNTAHPYRVNDIAFPFNYSDVFATCSMNDIRIWNAKNRTELLRIHNPNCECYTVSFMRDGKCIISGWSDGKIRAFYPQSGKQMFVINDAHINGVTAMASTSDCSRIVSGGQEGEVRIWRVGQLSQSMIYSLKQHQQKVHDIKIKSNDKHAISVSADGSWIVWDLQSFTRVNSVKESNLKQSVVYHPEESQFLTTGSDKKITYWSTFDAEAIRMLDGCEEGQINALAITREGEHFVSGGEDKVVRLWGYDEGFCYYEGIGHSGAITKLIISPDQKWIVSVGAEGAIFIWKTPEDVLNAKANQDVPAVTEGE